MTLSSLILYDNHVYNYRKQPYLLQAERLTRAVLGECVMWRWSNRQYTGHQVSGTAESADGISRAVAGATPTYSYSTEALFYIIITVAMYIHSATVL